MSSLIRGFHLLPTTVKLPQASLLCKKVKVSDTHFTVLDKAGINVKIRHCFLKSYFFSSRVSSPRRLVSVRWKKPLWRTLLLSSEVGKDQRCPITQCGSAWPSKPAGPGRETGSTAERRQSRSAPRLPQTTARLLPSSHCQVTGCTSLPRGRGVDPNTPFSRIPSIPQHIHFDSTRFNSLGQNELLHSLCSNTIFFSLCQIKI